ncbi:MAG: branched-chain amino acid ABC transporter permease [Proteobacteria bacterium]|nr:branched-chain amino acid ABC transporter permease [Pseudomonadota bacterium]
MPISQLLLGVLALGAAYALIALGFVLILNATGAVNFSQGDLVMAGGFGAVALGQALHWTGLALLPALLVGMAALGVVLAVLTYLPLRRRPPEAVFISTIAFGIILQNLANRLFGAEPLAAPSLLGAGRVRFAGVNASLQSLATIGVAALLIVALHVMFTHTQTGRRLRAMAQDRDVALAMGIPVDRMVVGTFAVAAALAGGAGLLLSNVFFVTPTSGGEYMVKAYIAVVIGGWGSIAGAVAGALLIAAFEVIYPSIPLLVPALLPWSDTAFSQTTSTIMLDAAVLLILMLRPQGLFGERVRQRP